MLFHVTVRYERKRNPTGNPITVRELVDYSRWMDTQTDFPVRKVSVYWGTTDPVGFAVFDAPDEATLSGYLGLLPGGPATEVHAVEPLADAVAEGVRLVAR
jgi:hypothetical protein